jgi:GNAT superfamily N-acetyltransferase
MEIVDLNTLPRRLHPQLAAFAVSDGDAPQDIGFIRRLRKMGHPASDYYAVYAVEDSQVLSRVESLQLPFAGRSGPQVVVGISDVATRPDGVGRGFARALMEEVHRREVARGRKWSFLWTHRSWGAHRLYESLGYEDVYSPPNAHRQPRASRRPTRATAYHLKAASSRDVSRLERLLRQGTVGRLGFVPRSPGSFRIRTRLGWRKLANHRLLSMGDRVVGYAYVSDDSSSNLTANELVVTSPEHLGPMLRALEVAAGRRSLTLQATSAARDAETLLRESGYLILPSSHQVLMAKPLVPRRSYGEDVRTVFSDPRLSSHRGDMF